MTADKLISYELKLMETTAGSGYFAAMPSHEPDFEEGVTYLRQHPFDDFMRKYLIGMIQHWSQEQLKEYFLQCDADDHVLITLFCEACLLNDKFKELLKRFSKQRKKKCLPHTSLIYIKSHLLTDHQLHAGWAEYFNANIYRNRPLPTPEKCGLPLLFKHSVTEKVNPDHIINKIRQNLYPDPPEIQPRPSAKETAELALERLTKLKIMAGEEMRHESSLSPYALLRRWQLERSIENRRMSYTISGVQTAYGKGIDLDAARASYAMEIVERCSAYATIEDRGIQGTLQPYQLIYGTRNELQQNGYEVLDPNTLGLEVPYADDPLHWIEAGPCENMGKKAVWVPVQCVFLFSNLDEISLYSGLGSTGLASGNTLAEAKLSALLEILERDCEAVSPFHPSRCFRVVADDPKISILLEDYRQRGIQIQFQDISPVYGVPCCKCFVIHRDGTLAKGTSAHLNGKQAVLSALTETPYPYPYGPPSMPVTMDLPVLRYEELPDISFNDATLDLALLEAVLNANGLYPLYVDLTRSDLDLPVVKAFIPGLETMNDFDSFTRISPRLFSNYLKIYNL